MVMLNIREAANDASCIRPAGESGGPATRSSGAAARVPSEEEHLTFSLLLIGAFLDVLFAACGDDQKLPSRAPIVPRDNVHQGVAFAGANFNVTVRRSPVPSGFGPVLRRFRHAAGLSQEVLAERARMSPDGISALERGYRRTPQRQTVALLAAALGLLGDEQAQFESAARSARAEANTEKCLLLGALG